MEVGVVEEHVLLDVFAAAQTLAVDLLGVGVAAVALIEVVVVVRIVLGGRAVYVIDLGIAVGKVAHIGGVVGIVLFADLGRGIQHQALHTVDLHIAAGLGRSHGGGVEGHAAGEEVHHQIDGAVFALDHHRVDKGGGVGLLRIHAVPEIVGEGVVPGLAAVVGIADDSVQGAGVAQMVPAGVNGGHDAPAVQSDDGGNAEVIAAAGAGSKGLALGGARLGDQVLPFHRIRCHLGLLEEAQAVAGAAGEEDSVAGGVEGEIAVAGGDGVQPGLPVKVDGQNHRLGGGGEVGSAGLG